MAIMICGSAAGRHGLAGAPASTPDLLAPGQEQTGSAGRWTVIGAARGRRGSRGVFGLI